MVSQTYELIARAMADRRQVLCLYQGHPRALCPTILGHTDGQECTLAYQFAGSAASGLPPGGEWKCLRVSKIDVELRRGKWVTGSRHSKRQACVKDVDVDVNPASPYKPKRSLKAMERKPRPTRTRPGSKR
ncbi:MAG: hypothetical protein JO141_25400 [Bradyrhizobium sp.]|nr:hypothetical protein [Bradyrhizobium sp.]